MWPPAFLGILIGKQHEKNSQQPARGLPQVLEDLKYFMEQGYFSSQDT